MKKILMLVMGLVISMTAMAWPGMEMPKLHVDGRNLVDEAGNPVLLHGFGQTYSPWFNEQGSKWSNYNVDACLKYNKEKIDKILEAGWKMNWLRLHMDPYWSNTPGVQTTGENDIHAFDMNRFITYLDKVFIPMAEYAISKGLYVVMRPPGVCPEEIAVGDSYHQYLKNVWAYISSCKRLTDNPHIMFELANEPVRIKGTDGQYGSGTDACNKQLTKFFQEIIDIMRENGCQNVVWVPGTSYQSNYAGFVKYPIKDSNYGFAVHVYPGWYGSDAIEPSHELGGNYGGGYESFRAGWESQITPASQIAPILITEMDWAPSKYNASWGKSITGKMLGEGFGGNMKLLADRTGNVSWMIFTGPELICQFDGKAATDGNYTFWNDPDACLWPAYHWYKEYAGDSMPAPYSTAMRFSTPQPENDWTIMTGGGISAALISQYQGYESPIFSEFSMNISDESIAEWDGLSLRANKIGTTDATYSYTLAGTTVEKNVTITSTPFPWTGGYFNPSIWETGSFDTATHTVTTGTYGFGGWQYAQGLDLSEYNYLIATLEGSNDCGVSFRVFDINNYWSDPAIKDFGTGKKVVFDLRNLNSNNGRKMDASHIYICGFWSYGGRPFRIKDVFVADTPDANGVSILGEDVHKSAVYTISGMRVSNPDALLPGLYIIDSKKVLVR